MAEDAGEHSDDEVNPFDGLAMFGDISRLLAGQGPLNWDAARQFAITSASGSDGLSAMADIQLCTPTTLSSRSMTCRASM